MRHVLMARGALDGWRRGRPSSLCAAWLVTSLLGAVLLGATISPAQAQRSEPVASAPGRASDEKQGSLEATVQAAFEGRSAEAAAALTDAGATYRHLLAAERLPRSGGYLVEVALEHEGEILRWPMKVDYADGVWEVGWQPSVTYARGLLNLIESGRLPAVEGAPRWGAQTRLPALPILVLGPRMVTPFGAITAEADARLVERSGDPAQGLSVSPGLVQHSKRWVEEVMEGDPSMAGVDLFVDAQINWERLNQAVFSIASVGLYELSLITRDLGSVVVLAPVLKASEGEPPPLVVGVYRVDEETGFRVGLGGEVFENGEACAAELSFCASGVEDFEESMRQLVPKASLPPTAMVAAPGDVSVSLVVAYLAAVKRWSPEVERVVLGYIQM